MNGNLPDVVDACGLQFFLGLADGGDFRLGVDDARDDIVVHVAGLAGDDLGNGDALVLRLVREHRPGDHVADGIDAGDIGAAVLVDLDAPARRVATPGRFQAETLGIGPAAGGDQHDVGVERLRPRRP